MNQEILILQASPRIEIVFYEQVFKVRKSGAILIDETEYGQLKSVRFIKGGIPWITGKGAGDNWNWLPILRLIP